MANDIWLWIKTHQEILQSAVLISFISFVVLLLAIPLIIIYLPKDYFIREENPANVPNIVRRPYLILKNGLGGFLVLAGLVMLLLPGQGLLTLVVGLSLMNIPGKRRIIRRFACYPPIFFNINRLRRRAGRPLLDLPECFM